MLRKWLTQPARMSALAAGAFLSATIVCDVPNVNVRFNGYDDDDDGYVYIEDCCYDDYYYADWWWF